MIEKAEYYLKHEKERKGIAKKGKDSIGEIYSKKNQWKDFLEICESIA